MSVAVYAIILPMRLFWRHWPLEKNEESAQGAVVKRPGLFLDWEVGVCSFQPREWFPRGSVRLDSQDAVALSILFSHVLCWQLTLGVSSSSTHSKEDQAWPAPISLDLLTDSEHLQKRHSVHPNSFHPKMQTLSLFIHPYFVPKLLNDFLLWNIKVFYVSLLWLMYYFFFYTMEVNVNQYCLSWVSKQWQNLHFGVDYQFKHTIKSILQLFKKLIDGLFIDNFPIFCFRLGIHKCYHL